MKYIRWSLILILGLTACASEPKRPVNLPRAAEINAELGTGYLAQGNLELAKLKFEKALEQNPKLPEAHSGYALLMNQLGQTAKAEKHFKRALRGDPNNSQTLNNYGTFLCSQNKYKDAEKQFLAALKDPLYRTPEYAYTNAGRCSLKNKDTEQAEAYFGKALQANPRFPDALFELGNLNYSQRKYSQASAYMQRYERSGTITSASLWLSIQLARALGNKDAEASYSLLLKNKFPDSEEAAYLRGSTGGSRKQKQ